MVDPIDGTSNYLAGIPIWAVLVALRVGGRSVVGVVHAPALGETYEAALGGGARMNDRPIGVEAVGELRDATVLFGSAFAFQKAERESALAAVVAEARRDRGVGDFWGHVLVARGAAHAMVDAERLSIWDVAALEPIVAEAGGRLTGIGGEPWSDGRPCLTSCGGALHGALVTLLHGRVAQ